MVLISESIKSAKSLLKQKGLVRPSKKWQGIEPPAKLWETFDVFLNMEMPLGIRELTIETNADLPWAEDHFQERICGKPLNPGKQYKNWPYYRDIDNDNLFRNEDNKGLFSHTYMERFWPPSNLSIRYPAGNWDNFIDKFKQDPHGRQHYFSIWHPEDQSPGIRRLPCTLGYYFHIIKMHLHCTYFIRSCDIFRHFHNDIYMTIRLAQTLRLELMDELPYLQMGDLKMWIGSLHCFEPEVPKLSM